MDHKNIILQNLKELEEIHRIEGEMFKARAYHKAFITIQQFEKPINNESDVNNLPNIGKSIFEKIQQIIKNGSLEIIQQKNKENEEIYKLHKIHGVGPKKALELHKKGITIDNIKQNMHYLNNVQKIGLKYYKNFQENIPRREVEKHELFIAKVIESLHMNLIFNIAGSYRRRKQSSNDIDVIITQDTDNLNINPSNIISAVIQKMKETNYLFDVLGQGKKKAMCICKLPKYRTFRRVDLLVTNKVEFPFALLYFTGNGDFNQRMRNHALSKGYSLNEYGIYNKDSKEPISDFTFLQEEDIFKFLDYPYLKPSERL